MDDLGISTLERKRDGSEVIRNHSVIGGATFPGDNCGVETNELFQLFAKSSISFCHSGDEKSTVS